jgi:hypothetical protein
MAPVALHVKFACEAFGVSNEPLVADHAYVRALAFGPIADAETAIELPTVVSAGLAVTELTDAQLYVAPLMRAEPACEAAVLHWSATETLVVVRATTLN